MVGEEGWVVGEEGGGRGGVVEPWGGFESVHQSGRLGWQKEVATSVAWVAKRWET